jgi:16S rRNA (uracil1498-N3)-methyltransferase
MKTPDSRFYCPLISVGTIILDENESSHAVRVCRAVNGEILQLCDGLGHYADATITKADAKACEVRVDTVEDAPLKRPRLNLGIACLKDDALKKSFSMRHKPKRTASSFCVRTIPRNPRTPT